MVLKWSISVFLVAFKSSSERKEKELEKQAQEFQDLKTSYDSLRKMLRKKEKEGEEKDREIASLNQVKLSPVIGCRTEKDNLIVRVCLLI